MLFKFGGCYLNSDLIKQVGVNKEEDRLDVIFNDDEHYALLRQNTEYKTLDELEHAFIEASQCRTPKFIHWNDAIFDVYNIRSVGFLEWGDSFNKQLEITYVVEIKLYDGEVILSSQFFSKKHVQHEIKLLNAIIQQALNPNDIITTKH